MSNLAYAASKSSVSTRVLVIGGAGILGSHICDHSAGRTKRSALRRQSLLWTRVVHLKPVR